MIVCDSISERDIREAPNPTRASSIAKITRVPCGRAKKKQPNGKDQVKTIA